MTLGKRETELRRNFRGFSATLRSSETTVVSPRSPACPCADIYTAAMFSAHFFLRRTLVYETAPEFNSRSKFHRPSTSPTTSVVRGQPYFFMQSGVSYWRSPVCKQFSRRGERASTKVGRFTEVIPVKRAQVWSRRD